MKFSCERTLLWSALQNVARVVPGRTTLAALEGILVEVGERLTLTAYNLEVGIRSTLDADIQKTGAAVVSARLLCDIVRKLDDLPVVLELEDKMVLRITCGDAEYHISSCLGADVYPELPAVEGDVFCTLPQPRLKDMLSRTLYALSDNDAKQVQTGALFQWSGGKLTIVAVDGYRLALRCEPSEATGGDVSIIVPGDALREMERVLSDSEEETVDIIRTDRHVSFHMEDTVLLTRLITGRFLQYESAISQERSLQVRLDTEALRQSVERVSLLIGEKIKRPVCFQFNAGRVTVSTSTMLGQAVDHCPAEMTGGEPLEIGFNHRYVLDALRVVPRDVPCRIELKNALSPCVIVPEEGEAFLFMILPVRLHAETPDKP